MTDLYKLVADLIDNRLETDNTLTFMRNGGYRKKTIESEMSTGIYKFTDGSLGRVLNSGVCATGEVVVVYVTRSGDQYIHRDMTHIGYIPPFTEVEAALVRNIMLSGDRPYYQTYDPISGTDIKPSGTYTTLTIVNDLVLQSEVPISGTLNFSGSDYGDIPNPVPYYRGYPYLYPTQPSGITSDPWWNFYGGGPGGAATPAMLFNVGGRELLIEAAWSNLYGPPIAIMWHDLSSNESGKFKINTSRQINVNTLSLLQLPSGVGVFIMQRVLSETPLGFMAYQIPNEWFDVSRRWERHDVGYELQYGQQRSKPGVNTYYPLPVNYQPSNVSGISLGVVGTNIPNLDIFGLYQYPESGTIISGCTLRSETTAGKEWTVLFAGYNSGGSFLNWQPLNTFQPIPILPNYANNSTHSLNLLNSGAYLWQAVEHINGVRVYPLIYNAASSATFYPVSGSGVSAGITSATDYSYAAIPQYSATYYMPGSELERFSPSGRYVLIPQTQYGSGTTRHVYIHMFDSNELNVGSKLSLEHMSGTVNSLGNWFVTEP